MNSIEVGHVRGDRFEAVVRGHSLVVDQPFELGGTDAGPTPTEVFVVSLVACVAFYVRRYLRRHGLPEEGLTVTGDYTMSDRPPSRVTSIAIDVRLPKPLPPHRLAVLRTVAERCTVHNSLLRPPSIVIDVGDVNLDVA